MPSLNTPVQTPSPYVPPTATGDQTKNSKVTLTLESFDALKAAVAIAQNNATAVGIPTWEEGQEINSADEYPIRRSWSASAKHLRRALIRPGLSKLLASDLNRFWFVTGGTVPVITNSIDGDYAIDWDANILWFKSGGVFGNIGTLYASTVTKASLGLDRVNNTTDLEKPVSTATAAAIATALASSAGGASATISGTIGASATVVDLAAANVTGAFLLNVSVASGCSITIETSRDGGTTYQMLGVAPWATDVSVQYSRAASDTSYVTHARLTRATGTATTSRYDITNGVVAFTGAQQALVGVIQSKTLVVDTTTRAAFVDPNADRGFLLQSGGPDQSTLTIRDQSVAPWDYSKGDVFFLVERTDTGLLFVNAAVGTNVVIYNPLALELVTNGPPLLYKSRVPNIWTVS